MKIAGCIEASDHPLLGKDFGTICGVDELGIPLTSDYSSLQLESPVVLDFSSAESTGNLLNVLEGKKARLVVGTTGLDETAIERLQRLSAAIPTIFSPNMSLGINLLFHLVELVASKLKGKFDIEIIETHHRYKKDSPSGTARRIGEIVASALDSSYDAVVRNGRNGLFGERQSREVGMHAVRGGDIVGDHTVLFAGIGERLELRHMAHSRSTLARGAIVAAQWLADKQPGLYSMRDVLGL
jgi:4-hydroxy-tetrahydrodipicolinate reductase